MGTEMREQVRLWFYSMLFMSVVLEDRAPYERVLSHNSVIAEDGSKFSKTGFMIRFDEAAEKIGADSIRYLYAGAPVANDVRFGFNLGDEARRKLLAFWNIFTFYNTYASIDKPDLSNFVPAKESLSPIDRWLVIRTDDFIRNATAVMDDYKTYQLVKEFEVFVDDISNWYIRTNRRRFWKAEDEADKMVAYWVLYFALDTCVKVMAPIIPFMTEKIWQELIRKLVPGSPISVHLSDWPVPSGMFEDDGIVEQTALARDVITTAMRLRNEQQLKVRQPLNKLFVCTEKETAQKVAVFENIILDELNIKTVDYIEDFNLLQDAFLTVNFKVAGAVLKQDVNRFKQSLEQASEEQMQSMADALDKNGKTPVEGWEGEFDADLFVRQTRTKEGIVSSESATGLIVALDTLLTEDLLKEGLVRDVVRQCQLLRKEAGYTVEQRITAAISSGSDFAVKALNDSREHIATELLALELYINEEIEADLTKEVEIGDDTVTLSVKKA